MTDASRLDGDGDGDDAPPLERVRRLAGLIEASAAQGERERRLPAPLVAALLDAGLYRLLLPQALGGAELDPATFARVIEAVSRADASPAWRLCQAAGCSMAAAYLAPAAAREIFGDPHAILAWGPGPDSRAGPVDGGYRVTGRWSFASGCRHATWLGGQCQLHEPDGTPRRRPDGAVESRWMLFPAARATIVDAWDVIGLRATGSDAFTVTDLFVPHAHSVARDDPAERRQAGPLYCFPTNSLYASGFAGVALGLARRTLDSFATHAIGEATAAVDFAYHAAGATAIFESQAFERRFRDIHTVAQQVQGREAHFETAGRFLLGLEPDTTFL